MDQWTEDQEFVEWVRREIHPVMSDSGWALFAKDKTHSKSYRLCGLRWYAWKAARQHRWKSMKSAPTENEKILVLNEDLQPTVVYWRHFFLSWMDGHNNMYHPLCWCELPDTLTRKEIEALE